MTQAKKGKRAPGTCRPPSKFESGLANLRSRDESVRPEAREALTSMGKPAVRRLIPRLNDPKDNVRWEAARALGDIGYDSADSDLVATLQDENGDVRWLAAVGLRAIGQDALVPLLRALIDRPDSVWLRRGAHNVLRDLARGGLEHLLTPIVAALDGVAPGIGLREPV